MKGRLLLAVLLTGWLLAGPTGVSADSTAPNASADSATPSPTLPPGGGGDLGIDGLIPPPQGIEQGNQPTLAEKYPTTAYTPFNISVGGAVIGALRNPVEESANVLLTVWASTEMQMLLVVATLTSRLLEWTFSVDIVAGAGGPLTQVVQTVADQIYKPLLELALIVTGLWLVWHMLVRRRATHGLSGIAWSLTAMVVAGVYFAAPVPVMSAADGATAAVSRAMLATIAVGDPQMANRATDPLYAQGDTSDAELRAFVDRYWRTFVFKPWTVAALGSVDAGERYGDELLSKWAGQPSNFDQDFRQAPQSAQDWFNGNRGGDRFAIVTLALIVAVLASVLLLMVAGAVVVAQFALLVLLMVAPLFLLVGVHPGIGRRLLSRWVELAATALLTRVLCAALLAVLLVISGLIAQLSNWGVAAALEIAMLVTAFIYRRPFMRVFSQVVRPRVDIAVAGYPRVGAAMQRISHGIGVRPGNQTAAAPNGGARPATAAAKGGQPVAVGLAATGGASYTAGTSAVALAAVEAGRIGVKAARGAAQRARGMADTLVVPQPAPASSNGHEDAAGVASTPPELGARG